ncbi:uncharacterized protein LOC121689656 [Alosa sapidissima]|uniref:uncharacterized protein LOC121689656 n=1 Tax=Alosa sapidissima TaxID=34773 RepID=UPI001C085285|nr:uncharacterized protein LOC121689656 [Alosa sapidissima]
MAVEIVLSLFLSAGLCAGLPTVIWALYSLRRHQDAGGHVSAFIILLILSDIAELLMSPFVNTNFLDGNPCYRFLPCWVLYSVFSVARLGGLHFHQLVVLKGILSLVYPSCSVHFLWCLIFSVTMWIFVICCHFFTFGYTINLIFCVVPVILAIITSVFTIRLSHSSPSPLRHKRPGFSVLAVALFTLVVLYMPCLVLSCVTYPDPFYDSPWATTVVSIMSLRVVTEPLLCVLVCRCNLRCVEPCGSTLHSPTQTAAPQIGSRVYIE